MFVSQDRSKLIVVAEAGLFMCLVIIADKDPEDADADEYPSPGESCSPWCALDYAHSGDPIELSHQLASLTWCRRLVTHTPDG